MTLSLAPDPPGRHAGGPAATRDLLVIGSALWLARELVTNTVGVRVHQSAGMFLPTHTPLDGPDGPAWWMPCSFATRLLRAGVRATLSAPGPFWMTEVPSDLLGREVFIAEVSQFRQREARLPSGGAFVKLAEAKDDEFPARWRSAGQLAEDIMRTDLPDTTWLQWSPTRLDLSAEYRCYVLDDEVLTSSLYLRTAADGNQITYYDGAHTDAGEANDALDFARVAVKTLEMLESEHSTPAGYVLDVGFDRRSARWVVIEANPAWSSAWYGCDIDSVVATIVRSSSQPDPGWEYVQDPLYVRHADRRGPLR